jgi:hypothetical protein
MPKIITGQKVYSMKAEGGEKEGLQVYQLCVLMHKRKYMYIIFLKEFTDFYVY